jgi:hydroxymethylbilane synthase
VLRLGTRRSRLALAQAEAVAAPLRALGHDVELVPIVTSGDRGVAATASPEGLKGLFVAEIVRALQAGDVDLAVHSAKDLPAADPEGVVVAAVPDRADPRDVLVSRDADVAGDAVIGTASLRRRAQLLRLRPSTRVVSARGNVDTRLARLEQGAVDALVLAAAGLARLGLAPANVRPFDPADMVPAPGQGALAVQARQDDEATLRIVKLLDHLPSREAFEAERLVVARLGGGCALPLGALAESVEGEVRLRAVVIRTDGTWLIEASASAPSAAEVGETVAGDLLSRGAGELLADAR